jgi:hypothetical protein
MLPAYGCCSRCVRPTCAGSARIRVHGRGAAGLAGQSLSGIAISVSPHSKICLGVLGDN